MSWFAPPEPKPIPRDVLADYSLFMQNTTDSKLWPASDADKNNATFTESIPNYADRLYWVLESFSGVSLNLDITLLGVDDKKFTDNRTDSA